jgi:hypothetical protein
MIEKHLEAEFTSLRQAITRVYQELDEILTRLTRIERTAMRSPAEEFHATYPDSSVDPDLMALVGMQPATSIEQDKAELQEALARKFG